METAFAAFADRIRAAGLGPVVIENFRHAYAQLSSAASGHMAEAEIAPVAVLPTLADLADDHDYGVTVAGRAAVLRLNGGLGTSMGLDRAKSLLVAHDGMRFLDVHLAQQRAFAAQMGVEAPLLFLNSFTTDADTRAVLAASGATPRIVLQNKIPKVLEATLAPAVWPQAPDLAWCPPGHGEVYTVLYAAGVLDELLAAGIDILLIANGDNLGATLDPALIGYMARTDIPFLMEVAERTANDTKGGHLARRRADDRLVLREVAQCPADDLAAFQDIARHRYFNTNNLWVNLRTLKTTLDAHDGVLKLPTIRNRKTLDPRDPGSPAVIQLESAMGAAIEIFAGAEAVCVGRARFAPVKVCADLLILRSDRYHFDELMGLRPHPDATPVCVVTLDQAFYKKVGDFDQRFADGAPSLRDCTALSVTGDVRFGTAISCSGSVQIINAEASQHTLAAGTKLADQILVVTAH